MDIFLQLKNNPESVPDFSEQRLQVKIISNQTFPEALFVEAEALLIGDRSGMDEELAADYRTLGITHLFAISGLHVGFLHFMFRGVLLRECLCEGKPSNYVVDGFVAGIRGFGGRGTLCMACGFSNGSWSCWPLLEG